MKYVITRSTLAIAILSVLGLSGCDRKVSLGSVVHEDGSIDRTLMLYDLDSAKADANIFNATTGTGWETSREPVSKAKENGTKEKTVNITFKKHFASVADANKEMDGRADTLFNLRSTFEKKNRWFYTYIEYTDTYAALDRFNTLPKEDFFTKEDYAFIERLPAEGKPITKGDSLFLARLTEKVFDFYGARTIFEELFDAMLITMREHGVAQHWQDSLARKKETIYKDFVESGNDEDHELLAVADRLKIPLPAEGREAFLNKSKKVENRIEFVSDAYSGKYQHAISMPWEVVETNADSVNDRQLYWNPPVVKFLLTDYTMTARARKMNAWAIVISALVVLVTITLFFVGKRK